MKITGYESLASINHWGRTIGDANGIVPDGITNIDILLLHTDDGMTGIGLGPHPQIADLFCVVNGEDPRAVTSLYDRMLGHMFKTGHSGAAFGTIGAIDMALWDLKAKIAGEPLWQLLGARERHIPGYASGLDIALDDDGLIAYHTEFADRGFAACKLKGGLDFEHDLHRLKLVRDIYRKNSAHPALMIDVNEALSPKQTIRYLAAIEPHVDLAWIEEPARRWDAAGHRLVRQSVKAAVATGENLTGIEQYSSLVKAEAVDILQTGMVWGITHFLRVAHLAHAHDLLVSPVSYLGNGAAHAAAAVPNHLSCELKEVHCSPEGVTVDQEVVDGGLLLGLEPGIGITIDRSKLIAPNLHADKHQSEENSPNPHVRPSDAGRCLVRRYPATS